MNFDPAKDVPSLDGKVILVTGGTAGLGASTITHLAAHNPAHIYFTGRNASAGEQLISSLRSKYPSVRLTFISMDMTSLENVKKACKMFQDDRLDILVANAGIMAVPASLTKDGYEMQFGVNHLAHAMLIQQLLPILDKTAKEPNSDVRCIILTSQGWKGHPKGGILFDKLNTRMDMFFGSWIRYGQAKLANVLYASELARRYPNITSVSVHPGIVQTGLISTLPFYRRWFVHATNRMQGVKPLDQKEGAYSQVWAAAGGKKTEMKNGGWYIPVGIERSNEFSKEAGSAELAKRLYDWTDKVLDRY